MLPHALPARRAGTSTTTLFLSAALVVQAIVMMTMLLRQAVVRTDTQQQTHDSPVGYLSPPVPAAAQSGPCPECQTPPPCLPHDAAQPLAARSLIDDNEAATPISHPSPPPPRTPLDTPLDDDVRRRFTDMTCYLYGDETELCVYDNVVCYDGQYVTLSVPAMPQPSKGDPEGLGVILGDPTTGCFDYRYYEPSALEYNNCKYDIFKFQRVLRYPNGPRVYTSSPSASATHAAGKEFSAMGDGIERNAWGEPVVLEGAAAATAAAFSSLPSPSVPALAAQWPLPLHHRRWGPVNRGSIKFREISDEFIFGPRPPGVVVDPLHGGIFVTDPVAASASLRSKVSVSSRVPPGTYFDGFDRGTDGTLKRLQTSGVRIQSVTRTSNLTVYWADGPLWFSAMDAQFDRHIYHATTRFLSLYAARRQNATAWGDVEGDGYFPPLTARNHPLESTFFKTHHMAWTTDEARELDALFLAKQQRGGGGGYAIRGNHVSYRTSAGWDLPSQSYVVLAGGNLLHPSSMIKFLKGMSELVLQPGGRYVSTGVMNGDGGTDSLSPSTKILCSSRGAVAGTHPRLFVSRSDAWLFRQMAYVQSGAVREGLISHPHHPPRQITLLIRPKKAGRNFENEGELIAVLRDSGIPVNVVEDMGSLTFHEQVLTMARTGILVAAHGAALVNSMFLPQHAVVIEVFPWMLKKMTYYSLASLMGLWYLPMFTGMPDLTDDTHYGVRNLVASNSSTGKGFLEGCVAANMSSVDSLLHHRCNSVSKHLPIYVHPDRLRETLREAIDIIAAFSVLNDAWKPELEGLQGISRTKTPTRTKLPTRSQKPRSRSPGPTRLI